jgi:hypothetical protein
MIKGMIKSLVNTGLTADLDIDIHNTTFKNPARPDDNFFWFHDVPHILKNLRTAFMKSGFVLPSGTVVGKSHLQRLVDKLDSEVLYLFI